MSSLFYTYFGRQLTMYIGFILHRNSLFDACTIPLIFINAFTGGVISGTPGVLTVFATGVRYSLSFKVYTNILTLLVWQVNLVEEPRLLFTKSIKSVNRDRRAMQSWVAQTQKLKCVSHEFCPCAKRAAIWFENLRISSIKRDTNQNLNGNSVDTCLSVCTQITCNVNHFT